jgi:hypothetical protein
MDDLERRIRDDNPLPPRDSLYGARAEEDLRRILTEPRTSPVPARRWRAGIGVVAGVAAAALAIIAGALALSPLLLAKPAAAVPPSLTIRPVSGELATILGELSMKAAAQTPTVAQDPMVTRCEWWAAVLTVRDDGTEVFVQPQDITRTWYPDHSGTIVVKAGEPRWNVPEDVSADEPGTILQSDEYPAGGFPLAYSEEPPSRSGSEFAEYLRNGLGLPEDAVAGDYFNAIQDLRHDRNLTGPQTAAMLQMLASLPGVRVAGEVTDRLGREGLAVETTSRYGGAFRDLLVFDRSTGMLLSAETEYLGGIDEITVPYPTVISYIAWRDPR